MNLLIYIIWPFRVYTVWRPSFIKLKLYYLTICYQTRCYSNIYTTYIAIYVTSQQIMVEKENKKPNIGQQKNLQRHKRWRGNYHKFWHGKKSVHDPTVRRRWDCAIEKKGLRRNQTTEDMEPTVPIQVSFSPIVKWLIDMVLEIKLCIRLLGVVFVVFLHF